MRNFELASSSFLERWSYLPRLGTLEKASSWMIQFIEQTSVVHSGYTILTWLGNYKYKKKSKSKSMASWFVDYQYIDLNGESDACCFQCGSKGVPPRFLARHLNQLTLNDRGHPFGDGEYTGNSLATDSSWRGVCHKTWLTVFHVALSVLLMHFRDNQLLFTYETKDLLWFNLEIHHSLSHFFGFIII